MKTYNKLMSIYENYLEQEVVEDTAEVISALTLWNVVNENIKKFQYYRDSNSELLRDINKVYRDEFKRTFTSGVDNYDYAVENFGIKFPLLKSIQFKGIVANYVKSNKTAEIKFILKRKVTPNKEIVEDSIRAYRDFNDDSFYGERVNRYLIDNCGEQLEELVSTFEFFASLVDCKETNQEIKNDFFEICINHSLIGAPSCTVRLSSIVDPDDSQNKKYVDKFYRISDRIECSKEALLKRTPVYVNALNDFCKALIMRHLKQQNLIEKGNEKVKK